MHLFKYSSVKQQSSPMLIPPPPTPGHTHFSFPLQLFDCFITIYLIFTKCITVQYNIPHLQGRLNLLVSPERRENSGFLSTTQQPSIPLGNNSAASLLVRTHLCHANCFVFWHPSCSKAFSLRKGKFSRGKCCYIFIQGLQLCSVLELQSPQSQLLKSQDISLGWSMASNTSNGFENLSPSLNWCISLGVGWNELSSKS